MGVIFDAIFIVGKGKYILPDGIKAKKYKYHPHELTDIGLSIEGRKLSVLQAIDPPPEFNIFDDDMQPKKRQKRKRIKRV